MNELPAALAQWEYVLELQPNRKGLKEKLKKAYREDGVEYGFYRTQSRNFQISYAPGTEGGDLRRITMLLERAYRDLGKQLGVYPPTPIQVVLYTAPDFAEATLLGNHVGAVYDGKIRVPIADETGRKINEADLKRRLYHEFTHVIVRYWVGDRVPWWLNEGLAQTLSEDFNSTKARILVSTAENGGLLPLEQLETTQLEALSNRVDKLQLAYLQAEATVGVLWHRYGPRGVTIIMNSLADGMSPEEALVAGARINYALLEGEVEREMKRLARQ
jgi:hypothetical protein